MKSLLNKADSRYTLVVMAAKRARQLTRESEEDTEQETTNCVSAAIKEIESGKVGYVRTRDGIK
jgi:DNA-directed RNA polymerase subunit omega